MSARRGRRWRVRPPGRALLLLGALSGLGAGCTRDAAAPVPALGPADWDDGRAELSGYALRRTHYEQPRQGSVVLVFVKETLSLRARVKTEAPAADDRLEVIKLNAIEDFRTGLYDYGLLSSVFVQRAAADGRPAGAPAKLVWSMQEWCGTVFEELVIRGDRAHRRSASYFEGAGDRDEVLPFPPETLAVDQLPVVVRGIAGPRLAPGERRPVHFFRSFGTTQLHDLPLGFADGQLTRSAGTSVIEVPAGRVEVETWTAELDADTVHRYWVERAPPHRLVAWEGPDAVRAELLGTTRAPYWELRFEGHERHLADIGLEAGALRPRRR